MSEPTAVLALSDGGERTHNKWLSFILLETSLQRTVVVSKCQVGNWQAHGPGYFGPCDCTLRREVIHFGGLSVVVNIFSRGGEHTFQIKQTNKKPAIFPIHNSFVSGLHFLMLTLKYYWD